MRDWRLGRDEKCWAYLGHKGELRARKRLTLNSIKNGESDTPETFCRSVDEKAGGRRMPKML